MITALLYHTRVRALSKKRVEITLAPTWFGRLLKRRERVGIAYRARDHGGEGDLCWWWEATDRYVGSHLEGYIEAAPVLQIEDMSVEQLLLEDPAAHADNPPPRKRS